MAPWVADRGHQGEFNRNVRFRQYQSRRDCGRSGKDAPGLERRRLFHDPESFRNSHCPHCRGDPHLCHVCGADPDGHGAKQSPRRCMLIARTFKSSLLQRWSAHLWQNEMTPILVLFRSKLNISIRSISGKKACIYKYFISFHRSLVYFFTNL